jgi:hypothetical protein
MIQPNGFDKKAFECQIRIPLERKGMGVTTIDAITIPPQHNHHSKKLSQQEFHDHFITTTMIINTIMVQFKLLVAECQTSGIYAKRAKQATKKDNAAACSCFLNYLAFLRPAADRAISVLPWVVSRGCSYGFLRADSFI